MYSFLLLLNNLRPHGFHLPVTLGAGLGVFTAVLDFSSDNLGLEERSNLRTHSIPFTIFRTLIWEVYQGRGPVRIYLALSTVIQASRAPQEDSRRTGGDVPWKTHQYFSGQNLTRDSQRRKISQLLIPCDCPKDTGFSAEETSRGRAGSIRTSPVSPPNQVPRPSDLPRPQVVLSGSQ